MDSVNPPSLSSSGFPLRALIHLCGTNFKEVRDELVRRGVQVVILKAPMNDEDAFRKELQGYHPRVSACGSSVSLTLVFASGLKQHV